MTTDTAALMDRRLLGLEQEGVDVVIIGAGINGAGLFRDLCEQGLSCLIVEKSDYGAGTSAAPSRLIHGGLKYLETGEFGLVAQSTRERNLLLKNAPHCVEPLETFIPIFSWLRGIPAALRTLAGSKSAPRSRGAVLIKIGLSMYDFYGAKFRVMPRHRMISRRKALADMPHLTPKIAAGGFYHDAKISRPERLVYELVQDGLAAQPLSAAINRASLVRSEDGKLTFSREGGGPVSVRPRLVVNAAGPWIDQVNAALGENSRLIGGTKGSHIILDHPELVASLKGRMIYFEADDGRILLVYDYLGRAMVGSTDIKADDPDNVRCEEEEIDYFLASLDALLPGLKVTRDHIVYAYSGIRPLPASDAANVGLISRDHSAPWLEPRAGRSFPVVSLVGGKWTTFRGFAEEVADAVLARLGATRRRSTETLPIGGGKDFPQDAAARRRWCETAARETGASTERAGELLARYGTTARAILAAEGPSAPRLPDSRSYSLPELVWIARQEHVLHLSDIVFRRTTLAVRGDLTGADLAALADVVGDALGWDDDRRSREATAVRDDLARNHRRTVVLPASLTPADRTA